MSKDNNSNNIVGLLISAILILFLIWIFNPRNPVEVEYNWYKEKGYTIFKINYNDFLECLPPTPIKEIVVSKEWLRDNAYTYRRELGDTLLAYCPDRNFICLATYDPSLDIAYILIWKPE